MADSPTRSSTQAEVETISPPDADRVAGQASSRSTAIGAALPQQVSSASPSSLAGSFHSPPPDELSAAASGSHKLDPANDSLALDFLRETLGHEPSFPFSEEDARRLVDQYHRRRKQLRPMIAPVLKKSTHFDAVLRDFLGAECRMYEGTMRSVLVRLLGDPLAKPDKENERPWHPLLADGAWLMAIVVGIALGFHYWARLVPFVQKAF